MRSNSDKLAKRRRATFYEVFNPKGFTLVELLVVLIILAIVSSLAFVSVGRSIARNDSKLFPREMISLCRKARKMAMGQGKITDFRISSVERRVWVEEKKPLDIPEEMLIEGEGVARFDEGNYGIRFFPDGSSSGGKLFLSVSGNRLHAFKVDVLTGMIEAIEGNE